MYILKMNTKPPRSSVASTAVAVTIISTLAILFSLCDANSSPGSYNPSSYGSFNNLGYSESQQQQQWQQPQQPQQQQQPAYFDEKQQQQQPEPQKLAPLPPGWTEHIDPSSGQPYYYFAENGTTTWDRPSAVEDSVTPEMESSAVEQPATESAMDESAATNSNKQPDDTMNQNDTATALPVVIDGHMEDGGGSSGGVQNALTPITRQEERVREEEAWREAQGWNRPQQQETSLASSNTDDAANQRVASTQTGAWGMPNSQQSERLSAGWGLNDIQGSEAPSNAEAKPPEPSKDEDESQQQAFESTLRQHATLPLPMHQPMDQRREEDEKPASPGNLYQPAQAGVSPYAQISPQQHRVPPNDPREQQQQRQSPTTAQQQHAQIPPGRQHELQRPDLANGPHSMDPPSSQYPGQSRIPQQLPPGQQPSQYQSPQQQQQQQTMGPPVRAFGKQPPPQRQQIPEQQQATNQRLPSQAQQYPYNQQQLPPQSQQQQQYPQGGYPYGQRPPQQNSPYGGQYGQSQPNSYRNDYGGQYGGPQGYRPNPGQGQLVTQEQPSALQESIGRTWQSILGFGNRTKEAVESASNTVAQTTREATQSLTEKGSGWFGIAKSAIGSLFEPSPDGTSEYQLSGIYGNVPPAPGLNPGPSYSQRAPPNYGQGQQPPPQQPGYPPRQGYPPNSQQPGMGQQGPQRNYPPNYVGPQPRSDAPHPFQQHQQQGQHPPVQAQWGPGGTTGGPQQQYPPQNRPYDPNRPQQYPPPQGMAGRPGGPQQHGPSSQQRRPQDGDKPDPWAHPGLGHEY